MTHEPERRLDLRLVPADAPADSQVLDDIIRLIQQGIVTAPASAPQISVGSEFRQPTPDEQNLVSEVVAPIKHRIEQASQDSQAAVEKRAALAATPGSEQQLADEARRAAEYVVAAVQRAILRGVKVQVPTPPSAGSSAVS